MEPQKQPEKPLLTGDGELYQDTNPNEELLKAIKNTLETDNPLETLLKITSENPEIREGMIHLLNNTINSDAISLEELTQLATNYLYEAPATNEIPSEYLNQISQEIQSERRINTLIYLILTVIVGLIFAILEQYPIATLTVIILFLLQLYYTLTSPEDTSKSKRKKKRKPKDIINFINDLEP